MSKERGQCRDILADSLYAVENALGYVERYEGEGPRAQEVKALFRSHLLQLRQRMHDLQTECLAIDHSRVGDREVVYHNASVDQYVNAPSSISRDVLLGEYYVLQQKKEFDEDRNFAECLVSTIFKELKIDSVPLVVFADKFEAIDMNSHWMVSIPIVLRSKHRAWWALAHEVGHAVQSRATATDSLGLLMRLSDFVRSEGINEEQKKSAARLLLQWVWFWLGELLADYVGLSFFGLYYLVELHYLDVGIDIGTISTSHPPMSFRLACLRAILMKREPTAKIEEGLFEALSPVPKEVDAVVYSLVTEKAVRIFADWLASQQFYQEIGFHWSDVLDAWHGKTIRKYSIPTLFAALGLSSIEEDVSESYDILRRRCTLAKPSGDC